MIYRTALLAFSLFVLTNVVPAMAQAPRPGDAEAQKMIDACQEISKEDRGSGVTGRMRAGALKSAECLEQAILHQSDIIFGPDHENIRSLLDKMADGYARYYWLLYNETRDCIPTCGTMFYPLHNEKYAELLEQILRDTIWIRMERKIDVKDGSLTK